jgi:hypothetical protein
MPEPLKLHDSIQSVVVLKAYADGSLEPVEVYEPEGVSRSTSKKLRPLERVVRRVVRAQQTTLQTYSERHLRSSSRKRNGWLKDFGKNVSYSMKKGRKALKIKSII